MADTLKVFVNDRWYTVEVAELDPDSVSVNVLVDGEEVVVEMSLARELVGTSAAESVGPATASSYVCRAPLPGAIIAVSVQVGDHVEAGAQICVLEAMKMHQNLRSEHAGTVTAVHVKQGQHVAGGDSLVDVALDG